MTDQRHDDDAIIGAMVRYGGSFVRALGHACRLADTDNRKRLKAAFPEYWAKYDEMAAYMPTLGT